MHGLQTTTKTDTDILIVLELDILELGCPLFVESLWRCDIDSQCLLPFGRTAGDPGRLGLGLGLLVMYATWHRARSCLGLLA